MWEGRGRGGKGWKHRGGEGEGGEGKRREGRAPPIFYCTPSFSFLEICLLQKHIVTNQSTRTTKDDSKSTMTDDVRSPVLIVADKFHHHHCVNAERLVQRSIPADSDTRCVVHLCPAHLQRLIRNKNHANFPSTTTMHPDQLLGSVRNL